MSAPDSPMHDHQISSTVPVPPSKPPFPSPESPSSESSIPTSVLTIPPQSQWQLQCPPNTNTPILRSAMVIDQEHNDNTVMSSYIDL